MSPRKKTVVKKPEEKPKTDEAAPSSEELFESGLLDSAAEPSVPAEGASEPKLHVGYLVRGIPKKGFYRVGKKFTREGTKVYFKDLTQEQVLQLESTPKKILSLEKLYE